MHARQQTHFAGNLANLIKRAPIRTPPLVQNIVAEKLFAQPLESALRQRTLLFVVFRNGLDNLALQRIHQVIAVFLRMLLRIERIVQPVAVFLRDLLVQRLIKGQRLDGHLLRIDPLIQLLNRADNFLDLRMSKLEGIHNRFFGNLQRAGLHHHDRVFRSRNHDVQQTLLLVRDGRIRH